MRSFSPLVQEWGQLAQHYIPVEPLPGGWEKDHLLPTFVPNTHLLSCSSAKSTEWTISAEVKHLNSTIHFWAGELAAGELDLIKQRCWEWLRCKSWARRCDWGPMGDLNPSRLPSEGQAGYITASHLALCMNNMRQSIQSVQLTEWVRLP